MGGKSTQQSTTHQAQKSQSAPWEAAQPQLFGILNQLGGALNQTGLTENEHVALASMENNAKKNNYGGLFDSLTRDLFAGGGATDQNPAITSNLAQYQNRLNPIADGQNIGPNGNPALRGYLDTIASDVQNRVNGMFAGAGRDLSGANLQTLSRGIAEGTAPVLANQYNTDVANQRSASDALYGAGNTTAGLLTGLGQQSLANRVQGASVAPASLDAANSGAKSALEIEAMRRGIPVNALGLLAQIGIPIAGLGQQSSGTGTSSGWGQNQMSGAQQAAMIGNAANNFINPIKFLLG